MPLIRNKIVAVYHCNEIQEALTLWHQNPDSFQLYKRIHPMSEEWKKWICQHKKKKTTFH